jgi:glycosyltransferase involved in cell wall biosynthesis
MSFKVQNSRIAVLIPSYNSSSTIGDTLESVGRQSRLEDFLTAVYLADDCSRDNTVAVAQQMWKQPVPLRVLCGACNLGERGNVNNGIVAVTPDIDWVLILHSDDLVKPHWLETMVCRIRDCSQKVATICSSWDDLYPDGSVRCGEDNPLRRIEVIPGDRRAVRNTLLRGCWWHLSGCAIRLAAFADIGGFSSGMPQLGDLEWLLRCLAKGWAVEYIPRTLMMYRLHASSVSSTSFQTDRDMREMLRILWLYHSYLSDHDIHLLHLRMTYWLLRRIGRALVKRSPSRCWLGCQTLYNIWSSWLSGWPHHSQGIRRKEVGAL